MVKSKGRILLGASYSAIEPLGLLHLGGLARNLGWDRTYHLVKNHDYEEFFRIVKEDKPDIVGFNIYTGNHLQLYEAFDRLKKDFPKIRTVIGGPHATYFPEQTKQYADYVVMSEGFNSLRKILTNEAEPGIMPMQIKEMFPFPDRETFYKFYEQHANSPIKSFITMTGCPYKCTYCYNSSLPEDIAASPEIIKKVKEGLSLELLVIDKNGNSCESQSSEVESKLNKLGYGRLFPFNVRSVNDVIEEMREIAESWPTQILYCQDDVHGFDIKNWLPELAKRWPDEVGIPYHAQMRWEMTKDDERLDILRDAGCFGLTLAIEAADYTIRKEVLDRAMTEDLMFEGMKKLKEREFRVRTEQITGLPYGATSKPTRMNIDADLELIELNVRLKRETGGPDMAWSSTLAPYKGTKLESYCEEYGHYESEDNNVYDTFFERSVLRFPKEWVGPRLKELKSDPSIWLDEVALEYYRTQNAVLRGFFDFFASIPEGHKLAENYIKSNEMFSYARLGRDTLRHLRALVPNDKIAVKILQNIPHIEKMIRESDGEVTGIEDLSTYFACLPKGELAVERAIEYAHSRGNGILDPKILSTAIRHHFYDNILYGIERATEDNVKYHRIISHERYPAKV